LPSLVHGLFLFQRVDQIDGGKELGLLALLLYGLSGQAVRCGIFPVPGQPISMTLSPPSMSSPLCGCRAMALLTLLKRRRTGLILIGREPGRFDLVGD
jgi:hypothetical protein